MMMKKTIISLVVMSVLLIIGFASSQISARMMIDNRVVLDRGVTYETSPVTSAPFSGFEIGDAIFRDNHFPTPRFLKRFNWVGHDAIYWHWVPDEKSDPTIKANHITMEEMRCKWNWRKPLKFGQLDFGNFEKFSARDDVWGVGAHKLHFEKRQDLVEIAKIQTRLQPRYAFRGGYKRPGRSFRCDGFVEWCYESVGIDIVPNDWWRPRRGRTGLTPALQFWSLSARIGKFQELRFGTKEKPDEPIYIGGEAIPLEDGKYRIYGEEVNVKIYANDIDDHNDGSGITRVQLWVGEPDDTPEEMPGFRIVGDEDDEDYPVDHDYVYTWDTTQTIQKDGHDEPLFPNGDHTLKVVGFDQAGNKAEAEIAVEVANPEKYLYVHIEPCFVETDGSDDTQTESFTIYVEAWNPGSGGTIPEGGVNKKEGTQSYKIIDGKPVLETCYTDQVEEATKDDTFNGIVNISTLFSDIDGISLYKEGWDGTVELTNGLGNVSGVMYKTDDGSGLDDSGQILVKAESEGITAEIIGNGLLMVAGGSGGWHIIEPTSNLETLQIFKQGQIWCVPHAWMSETLFNCLKGRTYSCSPGHCVVDWLNVSIVCREELDFNTVARYGDYWWWDCAPGDCMWRYIVRRYPSSVKYTIPPEATFAYLRLRVNAWSPEYALGAVKCSGDFSLDQDLSADTDYYFPMTEHIGKTIAIEMRDRYGAPRENFELSYTEPGRKGKGWSISCANIYWQ